MNNDLLYKVTDRLTADYGFKRAGKYLNTGKCPSCGKKELFTYADSPWVLTCGRINNCGAKIHIKDIYDDLFNDWSKNYVTTPENPNAAADAYLSMGRGFDLRIIKGWYAQGAYRHPQLDIYSATVKFDLACGAIFQRLIDRPERFGQGEKARIFKAFAGHWWSAPSGQLSDLTGCGELWLTEGIFNAIALMHVGKTAVSNMSSGNYPEKDLVKLAQDCDAAGTPRPVLVWALDSDKAGKEFTLKHIKRAEESGWTCAVAQCPEFSNSNKKSLDWNDYLQRGELTEVFFDEAFYHGKLLTAKNAYDKAVLIHERTGSSAFHLDYNLNLYWFEAVYGNKETDKPTHKFHRIANCLPQLLYFQRNNITDESWYYMRVRQSWGATVNGAFTSAQVAGSADFKKRLLHVAPHARYEGNTLQLDRFMDAQKYAAKTVETIDFLGYTKEYDTYVFGDVAVKGGQVYRINADDYFEINKLSIKTLNQNHLNINPDLTEFKTEFVKHIYTSFGAKGLVALAFWFGSLYAEQVRAEQKSFPFLEIVGEPGAGKTTLIEFMWKLCGRRDHEGFDPSKSTLAARARNMVQVANLPVVMIEADRGERDTAKAGGFDWDELKTAYNGRSPRSRGVKNGGNDTYEPPFRGSIVISQNAQVQASQAVMERIVHMTFTKSQFSQHSFKSAKWLEKCPIEQVSGFAVAAAKSAEKSVETITHQTFEREKWLSGPEVLRNGRIILNHAQLLAFWDAMTDVFGNAITTEMTQNVEDEVVEMAIERERSLALDHPYVREFWEVYEYLENGREEPVVNHSKDSSVIAINLIHFYQICNERRINVPAMSDIRNQLRSSRTRRFIDIKSVSSLVNEYYNHANREHKRPVSVKCWVFER